ncbi:MAG: hypothetical protein Q4D33_13745 [Prevotellaceae bacterium]|nr:hypothetical protein [Prevotellaceae bacterium]
MKKYLMTLAAVLCCALTISVFTSCGGDDDESTNQPQNPAGDNTPKKVMMVFGFYATQDMMDNCDILVTCGNETEAMTLTNTTKVGKFYKWEKTVAANELPANFTFSRKVTLKHNIDAMPIFEYTPSGYSYSSSLYNAEGKSIAVGGSHSNMSTIQVDGVNMTSIINNGKLDNTITVSFDQNGACSHKISKTHAQ